MKLALSELLCYAAIAVVLDRKYRRNARKRREWTKQWLLKGQDFSHVILLKELRFHPKDWHNFLRFNVGHPVVRHYTIIYKYLRQYTTILVLMQLYFVRGDMFRLIIQPSSGQLTIERYLIILRPIWDPTLFTHNAHKINSL